MPSSPPGRRGGRPCERPCPPPGSAARAHPVVLLVGPEDPSGDQVPCPAPRRGGAEGDLEKGRAPLQGAGLEPIHRELLVHLEAPLSGRPTIQEPGSRQGRERSGGYSSKARLPFSILNRSRRPLALLSQVPFGSRVTGDSVPITAVARVGRSTAMMFPGTVLSVLFGGG